jgi:hypothetical protein
MCRAGRPGESEQREGRCLASSPMRRVHSGMGATLIESPDEHHWVLLDHKVTQIVVDASSFRVQTWSLEGSAEVRCSAPFTIRQASGAERTIDPMQTETLAPILALLRRRLESLTITRDGELTAAFSGGLSLVVSGGRRIAAWEVHGGGALEGMSYTGALPSGAEQR